MKIISIFILIILTLHGFSHPLVSIYLSTKNPKQGDAVWIKIKTSKKLKSGHIKFGKKRFKLFNQDKSKNQLISCIGISRYIKPKKSNIHFAFTFSDNSRYQTVLPIKIVDAQFKKEHIKLKPKIQIKSK